MCDEESKCFSWETNTEIIEYHLEVSRSPKFLVAAVFDNFSTKVHLSLEG